MSRQSSPKARKFVVEEENEYTAQPMPIADDLREPELNDVGMSVDPDDLGAWALRSATQEIDPRAPNASPPLSLNDAPLNDDAFAGPNFDPDVPVWDQTVDMALQSGGLDGTRDAAAIGDTDNFDEDEDEALDDSFTRDIDLKQNVIRDGSLFDLDSADSENPIEPNVDTDNDSPEHLVDSNRST
ncbi:MAG TPA: hypothetical protein VHZ95_05075 [Polyangiales bacterium]|jgi:hypothetical protein|nr:hypothetical protein [Polyangiales bacterium]